MEFSSIKSVIGIIDNSALSFKNMYKKTDDHAYVEIYSAIIDVKLDIVDYFCKNMTESIKSEFPDGPICPNCGYIDKSNDDYLFDTDSKTHLCDNCDSVYDMEVICGTSWITNKITPKDEVKKQSN